MERQRRFDYANPLYLSNVLVGVVSLAMGTTAFLKIGQIAEQEKKGKENVVVKD